MVKILFIKKKTQQTKTLPRVSILILDGITSKLDFALVKHADFNIHSQIGGK